MSEIENNTVDTKKVKFDTVNENIVNDADEVNDISEVIDEKTESTVFHDLSPDNFDHMVSECDRKNRIKKSKKSKKNTNLFINVLSIVRDTLICFFIALLISTFLFVPIKVDGKSMYPTLHDNDIGFSSVISLNISDIKRFDIVIVYDDENEEYLVKRVVGMPNETIQYAEDTLYIDGVKITEDFFDEEYCLSVSMAINDYFTDDFKPIVIGDGEYFVMGDNRPSSKDSRDFGVIKESQITSKGVFVIYPFSRIGVK